MIAGLHLSALWSLAVAEPLFDLLHKNPDFLAARGMDGRDIVLFGLVLALGPPLVLLAIEALIGLASSKPRRIFHLFCVAALLALLVIQALKATGPDQAAVLIALAVAAGVGGAALYQRARGVRSFLTVLSLAPVLFLALFLLSSPVKDLVFASNVDVSAATVANHVPVVMVVFDEVSTVALEDRRERIDPTLFPNLASLAGNATWFRYATAPTDETTTAVPALLTGSPQSVTHSRSSPSIPTISSPSSATRTGWRFPRRRAISAPAQSARSSRAGASPPARARSPLTPGSSTYTWSLRLP